MNNVFKQQIEALAQVGLRLQDGLDAAVELILSKKGKVVVTGIGKSGIVAHKIAATLAPRPGTAAEEDAERLWSAGLRTPPA